MLNRIEVMAPPKSAPQYMQESMMIAEVGGIVKVRGSKIATPLAPPRPGSTPMMTPRMMPIIINIKLNGVRTTAKPWNKAFNSSKCCSVLWRCASSVTEKAERIKHALEQRHLEPHFEHHKKEGVDDDADRDTFPPCVLAEPEHEDSNVNCRGDVQPHELDADNINRSGHQYGKYALERTPQHEWLASARFVYCRLRHRHEARNADQ